MNERMFRAAVAVYGLVAGLSLYGADGYQDWDASEIDHVNFKIAEFRDQRGELGSQPLGGDLYRGGFPYDCRISQTYARIKTLLDPNDSQSLYKMSALDLVAFFPDRTIKTRDQLMKIHPALYELFRKQFGDQFKTSNDGADQRYIDQWIYSMYGGYKIPFPASQEKQVREALIGAAKAKLRELEPMLDQQRRDLADGAKRKELLGMVGTDPSLPGSVLTPRERVDPLYQTMLMYQMRSGGYRSASTWGGTGAPHLYYVADPRVSELGLAVSCYSEGAFWVKQRQALGRPLSDADQKTLFMPPKTADDFKALDALYARLFREEGPLEEEYQRIQDSIPKLVAGPDDTSPREPQHHDDNSAPWQFPRILTSRGFASGLEDRVIRGNTARSFANSRRGNESGEGPGEEEPELPELDLP